MNKTLFTLCLLAAWSITIALADDPNALINSSQATTLALKLNPTNAIPGEVWISPTNSAGYFDTGLIYGLGTLLNPFYGDYDAIINSIPPYTTINLLPGTFLTRGYAGKAGDPVYKAGQQLKGSGMDVTVIKRSSTFYGLSTLVDGVINSTEDSLKFEDFTVDASGSAFHLSKVNGVSSKGNDCLLDRLKVMNTCGNGTNGAEDFSIFIGNASAPLYSVSASYGNTVQNCIVTNLLGTYCDGIQISGSYLVCNNKIYMPVVTNKIADYSMFGLNAGATLNGQMINNYVYGGTDAIHSDTGSHTNWLVAGNRLINCVCGVNIQPAPNNGYGQNGLFFINNIVELETLYWSTFRFGIGLWNYETNYAPWTRIFITGNSIHFLSDVHPQIDSDWFSIAVFDQAIATNFTGVQVLDNNVDSALYGTFPPVGVWLANNTDLNGVPISANGFTNSLDTRFFQNSQSVALALPQSPLNAGLVLNFSMIEGAGTNVHNYAQSYAIPDATYTQAGSVIGQINWTNSAVGFGIVTSNSAPTTDDLSTLTNYIGFTMPTNFGGSKSFTVSTVLRHPYFGANQPILFFGCLPGVGTPWFTDFITPGGGLGSKIQTTQTNFQAGFGIPSIIDGNFHDVTYAYDGANLIAYFDGTLQASFACTGNVPSLASQYPSLLYLGALKGGVIGQTRLWNRCLTANEVKLLYRQSFPP